ncbi:hypothetical protein HK405_006332 [Cladochytrium tenue]|nr:hypothetical protein HK405_006332 [Cladochytrium tenue]
MASTSVVTTTVAAASARRVPPPTAAKAPVAAAAAGDVVGQQVLHAGVGLLFGFAVGKAQMWPAAILTQLRLESAGMMQVFAAAVVSGMASMATLERLGAFRRVVHPPLSCGLVVDDSVVSRFGNNIVGGVLLGSGMALSGACPSAVLVQLGAGIPTAPFVLAGGLAAAVVHGYAVDYLRDHGLPTLQKQSGAPLAVDELLRSKNGPAAAGESSPSYLLVTAVVAAVAAPALATLAVLAPTASASVVPTATAALWHPLTAGLFIGLVVQPASILVGGAGVGTSTAFSYVAAQGAALAHGTVSAVTGRPAALLPSQLAEVVGKHSSLSMAAGAVLGGLLATVLTTSSDVTASTPAIALPSPAAAFFGGALTVLGSRLAGGCLSGHGLTGMGQLGVASFVTVAAIFAGGLTTAAVASLL